MRQEVFLDQIRTALGQPADADRRRRERLFADRGRSEAGNAPRWNVRRNEEQQGRLLDLLRERAAPLNLSVHAVADDRSAAAAIRDLVRRKDPEWGSAKSVVAWDHERIRRLDLESVLANDGIPLTRPPADGGDAAARAAFRRRVADAFVGVTTADHCVADTATLVMKTRPGQARSVSLVPAIHVAVIEIGQLLPDLRELYARLKHDPDERREGLTNCMTFVSGPSKTADIELIMVHGAHGPRELHLFVITG